ncbi:hypothetical protein BS78_06G283000 [Paspalum vaginatum]|nr:hypothetical protein BS78_06G283000 [Paspalum vaginatum]
MANANGSSAGGASASHGDPRMAISHEQYLRAASMASVHRAAPGAANVHHHQYPTGLIPPPVGSMPAVHHVPAVSRPPYSPPQIAVPPLQPSFVPPPENSAPQSQLSTEHYPDYSLSDNVASSHHVRGFASWGTHNNPLMSLAHSTTFGSGINNNGLHQNFSPYTTHTWTTTYVSRNPYNSIYAPATMNMPQTHSFHNNHHEKDPGEDFATTNFTTSPSMVPTSPFRLLSPRSPKYTSTQIFEETNFEETNNLEDTSRIFGSGDIKSENSEEQDPTPAVKMEDPNQGNGHVNVMSKIKVNCQDYRIVLRKDLTNSDVGNIGRIVLPKKDAEPNLPILEDKDGLILEMDDFELPAVWKFKYRYWPNNKSRMYILETTGEFVKRHGLQAKDILIIYRNKKSGRYVARAVKAEDIQMPECECIKAGNLSEECGFVVGRRYSNNLCRLLTSSVRYRTGAKRLEM